MNVLIEMTALSIGRPSADASVETIAAWYEAKSKLHEHIAAQGGPDSARESAIAAAAHDHALQLLRRPVLQVA